MLLLSGASLFLVGAFPTDLEGSPTTFHGAMHVALSAVVFIASPAGMLLVSSGTSRRWFLATIAALGAAVVFAATGSALAVNINGLIERGYIGVLAGWWLAASLKALRSP